MSKVPITSVRGSAHPVAIVLLAGVPEVSGCKPTGARHLPRGSSVVPRLAKHARDCDHKTGKTPKGNYIRPSGYMGTSCA